MFYRNLIVLHETSQHKFINNEKYFSVENAKGFFDSDSFLYTIYIQNLSLIAKKWKQYNKNSFLQALQKILDYILKLLMGQYIKISLFIIFNQNS